MPPAPPATEIPDSLAKAFLEGDRRACARLITLVENDSDAIPAVRDAMADRMGKAIRIGITGPPGVGKSTLTALLAKGLADHDHRVGIIAVDPSSPFTGGAFMGDRIRMENLVGDERIFMRSMASRLGRGGLSPATPYVADVLEGFGMDRILIETVGVGQSELDVMSTVDLVVLVLQPSTGDAIQTLKAGIIEAADVIAVNKADLPGVDGVLQSLRFVFSLSGPLNLGLDEHGKRKTALARPAPTLIPTSAQQNQGIDELVAEVERQTSALVDSGRLRSMKTQRIAAQIEEAIRSRLWREYAERSGANSVIAEEAAKLAETGESPYPFIRNACRNARIEIQENHGDR